VPPSIPHTYHRQFGTHTNTINESADEIHRIEGSFEYGTSPISTKGKAASEDATLKKAWDEVMIDLGSTGKPHRQAAVLMLSWAEELDDLHTLDEVSELQNVFEELFNYEVMKRQLSGKKKSWTRNCKTPYRFCVRI
jgi:hypothetical protein